jgi:hypothetical protein
MYQTGTIEIYNMATEAETRKGTRLWKRKMNLERLLRMAQRMGQPETVEMLLADLQEACALIDAHNAEWAARQEVTK